MARVSSAVFRFIFSVLFALCVPNGFRCRDHKLLNEEHFLPLQNVGRSEGTGNGGASASCHASSHESVSKGGSPASLNCNAFGSPGSGSASSLASASGDGNSSASASGSENGLASASDFASGGANASTSASATASGSDSGSRSGGDGQ